MVENNYSDELGICKEHLEVLTLKARFTAFEFTVLIYACPHNCTIIQYDKPGFLNRYPLNDFTAKALKENNYELNNITLFLLRLDYLDTVYEGIQSWLIAQEQPLRKS